MFDNNVALLCLMVAGIAITLSGNVGLNKNSLLMILVVVLLCSCMKMRNSKNMVSEMCLLVTIYFASVILSNVLRVRENWPN